MPTWNYDVLNVYGRLVAHDDPEWVLNLVTTLTNRHESGRATPWQGDQVVADRVNSLGNTNANGRG